MILNIFTIYDAKAKAYITPFFLPTAGMATRTFTDMVNDSTCAFSKHPEDYTLFSLGSMDDNTAAITLEQTPLTMHNGVTLLNPDQENANEVNNETPILASAKS